MVIVTLAARDIWCGKRCPNCVRKFRGGEDVFLSADEQTAIHVECVVALALVATLRTPTEAQAADEYRANRVALIESLKEKTDG